MRRARRRSHHWSPPTCTATRRGRRCLRRESPQCATCARAESASLETARAAGRPARRLRHPRSHVLVAPPVRMWLAGARRRVRVSSRVRGIARRRGGRPGRPRVLPLALNQTPVDRTRSIRAAPAAQGRVPAARVRRATRHRRTPSSKTSFSSRVPAPGTSMPRERAVPEAAVGGRRWLALGADGHEAKHG